MQNLQKKLALVEADYNAHQERIDTIGHQAKDFQDSGHFNAPQIVKKQQALQQRFQAIFGDFFIIYLFSGAS